MDGATCAREDCLLRTLESTAAIVVGCKTLLRMNNVYTLANGPAAIYNHAVRLLQQTLVAQDCVGSRRPRTLLRSFCSQSYTYGSSRAFVHI